MGKWIVLASGALLALSVGPGALYGVFVPDGGNQGGLGLLAAFGSALFGSSLVVGGGVWLVGWLIGRRH